MARLRGLISPLSSANRWFAPGDAAPAADFDPASAPLEIRDARRLQARRGSEALCFDRHGFAVLHHPTAVRDWRSEQHGRDKIADVYCPEIEALVRDRLFPGQAIEIDQSLPLLCRGGENEVIYADWVHQDFGLTIDDFLTNVAGIAGDAKAEWLRAQYARDDVAGCIAISFWRTIGMRRPLRHMPLALCDPASVDMGDIIAITPAASGGTHHIGLRFDSAQRWYQYPGMRFDEVLAFKLFECSKADFVPDRLRSVFHTAFADPSAPPDAEKRRSCEHRAIVMVLRD